jgi:hypothetical protein
VNGRWTKRTVENHVTTSGKREVKVKEDCATAIHTYQLQPWHSYHFVNHGIYAFSPHLNSWMPTMGANILLFLPRRPPANNANVALFCTNATNL